MGAIFTEIWARNTVWTISSLTANKEKAASEKSEAAFKSG
jgi:hypothetical protein